MNKQQIVANMVKEGTHTRQEILEKADCTPAALAGYFSSMRNAAQFTDAPVYPVEKEIDGRKVFTAMTFEDAEARRAHLKKLKKLKNTKLEDKINSLEEDGQ